MAKIKVIVKRILRIYGYPHYKQRKVVVRNLKQSELIVEDWLIYNHVD